MYKMINLKQAALSLLTLASASTIPTDRHTTANIANQDGVAYYDGVEYNIPTVHESAVQARRILHLESIGTLSTTFPATAHSTENRPADVDGAPIGLMDYYGDCEPSTGNPTILAIQIATAFKNVAAGSNISLSLRWHAPYKRPYSAAAVPRFNLLGYLEDLTDDEVTEQGVTACFLKYHPDAAAWLPGNRIHRSKWVRLVVQEIYWIGGFGDRAYIGWIPREEWQNITREEIEKVRLPGEKTGWGLGSGSWRGWLGLGGDQETLEL